MAKTTPKQYEIFQVEVKKWIEIFGLKDWQIHFQHKSTISSRAQVRFDSIGCIATFTLATSWNELDKTFLNDTAIKKAGFHEVCELLLGRLRKMTGQRYGLLEGDIDEEIHRIIRILENTIWEKNNE
ncbi:MAG TPA: hypothetical protein ENH82_02280 [bacterium]|nr:hypothetical protein [bacterium]